MSPHDVFSGLNLIAGIGWALLVLFPRKRWVVDAVAGKAIPALLAVVYAAIVAAEWRGSEGGFSSLTEVATLFANPWILLAGWIHYLAFDLFVGCWEVRDAAERGIRHLLVVPCLVLTFLFGPAGWLLYLVVRSTHRAVIHRGAAASSSPKAEE
jgi:hypothetical protein